MGTEVQGGAAGVSKSRQGERTGPHSAFFGWGYIKRWWGRLAKAAAIRREKRRERQEWKKEVRRTS